MGVKSNAAAAAGRSEARKLVVDGGFVAAVGDIIGVGDRAQEVGFPGVNLRAAASAR